MPHELLEMSRGVLREKFSAVIQKQVYTFLFDRFSSVDDALLAKLRKARDTRAVVVTSPEAIKSFVLKFIQCIHMLDQAGVEAAELEEDKAESGFLSRNLAKFGFGQQQVPRTSARRPYPTHTTPTHTTSTRQTAQVE